MKSMAKLHVEDILYAESFKNKKGDKIEIKFGINWKKASLFLTWMNSQFIIFPCLLEKSSQLSEIKWHVITA